MRLALDEAEVEAEALTMRLARLPKRLEKNCEECQGEGTVSMASDCSTCGGSGRVEELIPSTWDQYQEALEAEERARAQMAYFSRTPEDDVAAEIAARVKEAEAFASRARVRARVERQRRAKAAELFRTPNFHFGVRVELPPLVFPPSEETYSRNVADALSEVKL